VVIPTLAMKRIIFKVALFTSFHAGRAQTNVPLHWKCGEVTGCFEDKDENISLKGMPQVLIMIDEFGSAL